MVNKQQNDEEETITLIGLCTVLGVSLFTIFGIIHHYRYNSYLLAGIIVVFGVKRISDFIFLYNKNQIFWNCNSNIICMLS